MATVTSVYTFLCNCVYGHALSCTERSVQASHGNAFGVRSLKQRPRKKKLAIYRAWPWISNCWEWDPNSGLLGLESSALTTRPRRRGANLRCDVTSHVLFLNQSVLADFDNRKKKDSHFMTRSLSGTSKMLFLTNEPVNEAEMIILTAQDRDTSRPTNRPPSRSVFIFI